MKSLIQSINLLNPPAKNSENIRARQAFTSAITLTRKKLNDEMIKRASGSVS